MCQPMRSYVPIVFVNAQYVARGFIPADAQGRTRVNVPRDRVLLSAHTRI
jgi:hypothetical protein